MGNDTLYSSLETQGFKGEGGGGREGKGKTGSEKNKKKRKRRGRGRVPPPFPHFLAPSFLLVSLPFETLGFRECIVLGWFNYPVRVNQEIIECPQTHDSSSSLTHCFFFQTFSLNCKCGDFLKLRFHLHYRVLIFSWFSKIRSDNNTCQSRLEC